MQVNITSPGKIKLNEGDEQFFVLNAIASVDLDGDGSRDMEKKVRFSIPSTEEASITIDGVEVTLNAAQVVRLLRKLCRTATKDEIRRVVKLGDAMPDDVE